MSSPLERRGAAGGLLQRHQQPREGRLAAAGLPHEAERLALGEVEGDPVDGLDVADLALQDDALRQREVLHQVTDLEHGLRRGHRGPPRRSGRRCVVVGDGEQRGLGVAAHVLDVRAPGVERAALRELGQVRRDALDRVELLALQVHPRDGGEQALGVRVAGVGVDVGDRGLLDDPAGVHHRDRVGDVGDHAEVVGDEDQAHVRTRAAAPRAGPSPAPARSRRARWWARRRSARRGPARSPSRS